MIRTGARERIQRGHPRSGHALRVDVLGNADNTIVIYSTDNGAETVSWGC
jgi:hypothetical protein